MLGHQVLDHLLESGHELRRFKCIGVHLGKPLHRGLKGLLEIRFPPGQLELSGFQTGFLLLQAHSGELKLMGPGACSGLRL